MRYPAAVLLAVVLSCDGGLKPEIASNDCRSGICGVVHLRGVVPDSTDYVRVVVYASVPTNTSELTALAGFSDPLPLGADSIFYSCCITPLVPGSYAWALVMWKKVGALNATTAPELLREIGSYKDPADTTHFGTVNVPASGVVTGINITGDYGRMHNISDYFPPSGAAAQGSPVRPRR